MDHVLNLRQFVIILRLIILKYEILWRIDFFWRYQDFFWFSLSLTISSLSRYRYDYWNYCGWVFKLDLLSGFFCRRDFQLTDSLLLRRWR